MKKHPDASFRLLRTKFTNPPDELKEIYDGTHSYFTLYAKEIAELRVFDMQCPRYAANKSGVVKRCKTCGAKVFSSKDDCFACELKNYMNKKGEFYAAE